MGTKDETESILPNTGTLIDFLYVDKDRVDSLISQQRNGTLRSVVKTTGASEGSSISGKIGIPNFANGSIYQKQNNENKASEEYDPCHSQLAGLINDLNIIPSDSLPEVCSGKLVLLRANLAIRDLASIKAIMPIFSMDSPILGQKYSKTTKNILKLGENIIKVLPDSITLTITFRGTNINGTLKEEGLSIKQSDLIKTYGVDLPGNWYVLGILDSDESSKEMQTTNISSMENLLDSYARVLTTMYSMSKYKIIPVLIFRTIHL